ncbi:LysR family transcriptional regulator [Bradyrhizobium sp. AUGA SZCCT0431]|nr:LysR family transcriptional regulator [Bradyrhizobium sp. AUGA SZCCT0431]
MEGSFTKAAERLRVSQPAVSKQLKELEEAYGVKLCSRHGGQVKLTEHGEKLLDIIKDIFLLEDQADDFLRSAKGMEPMSFRVGSDAPYSVSELMSRYCQRHPTLPVSLTISTAEETVRKLLSAAIDVAVLIRVDPDPRLHIVQFAEHTIMVIVPVDHAWSDRESIQIGDLNEQPMVVRSKQVSLTSRVFDRALRVAGVRPVTTLAVDSREAMKEAVAAGVGIGVIPEIEAVSDRRLKPLRVSDATMTIPENVVCLKERRNFKAIASFLQVASTLATRDRSKALK